MNWQTMYTGTWNHVLVTYFSVGKVANESCIQKRTWFLSTCFLELVQERTWLPQTTTFGLVTWDWHVLLNVLIVLTRDLYLCKSGSQSALYDWFIFFWGVLFNPVRNVTSRMHAVFCLSVFQLGYISNGASCIRGKVEWNKWNVDYFYIQVGH